MVTKVTASVLNLQNSVTNFGWASGNGINRIDATPVGSVTPSTGVFTNLQATTNLNVTGATVIGLQGLVANAVIGTPVAATSIVVSSDGNLVINTGAATKTPLVGTATLPNLISDGFKQLSTYVMERPTIADVGVVVPNNSIAVSKSSGNIFVNLTGATKTLSGSTDTTLTANGLVSIGSKINENFFNSARIGSPITSNAMVISSDGVPMINFGAGTITPSTGTATAANLVTDGLTDLGTFLAAVSSGKIITNAAIGTAVASSDIVVSSDNIPMINLSGASITPSTGTATAANLVTDGLTNLGTFLAAVSAGKIITNAAIGTAVASSDIVVSSDNIPMINLSGASITPSTGTATAANLITDGLTNLGTFLAAVSAGKIITNAAIGTAITPATIVLSSDNVLMINNTAVNVVPSTGTATSANLITDGLVTLQSYISTPASTTSSGIIELATNTEVQTGTDTIRAVTPSGLTSRIATTTATGIISLATNTEAVTGTNTTKAITPISLTAAINQALTGTLTFKGGYDASTNTPNLTTPVAGTVNIGDYYVVGTAGTFFGTALGVGDSIFSKVLNPTTLADWVIVPASVPYATTTAQGLITLATATEVQSGTEATKALTSATLHNAANTPILLNSGINNTAVATAAQISAATITDKLVIELGGSAVARMNLSDVMTAAGVSAGKIVTNAAIGTAIANNDIVLSSDGVLMLNKSGASITPSTGTATAANLTTDGLSALATSFGSTTGNIVTNAAIGTAIANNDIVVSSDGVLMINKSGASITPSTGTATAANLTTDGLVTLSSSLGGVSGNIVTNAAIGTAIANNDIVVSSDGVLMINKSGGAITPSTGTATAANLTTDGLVTLSSSLGGVSGTIVTNAAIGTAIANNDIVISSDGVLMVNKSGASITPSTGTATAANLTTDGLITLVSALGGVSGNIVTNAAIGTPITPNTIVVSSDGVLMVNKSGANITPATGTATAANLTTDGLITLDSSISTQATTTNSGIVELATLTEVQSGTDAVRAVTPSTLFNTGTTPIIVSSGMNNTAVATAAQISAATITDKLLIELGGTTVARMNLSDVMTAAGVSAGKIVTNAAIGTAVANNDIVISSDGVLMINKSGASITPATGTATAANLTTDGLSTLASSLGGSGVSGNIVTNAAIGTAIPANDIVVSSDGVLMINKSGATITPATGTATAANLITDGLITLNTAISTTTTVSGVIITNAAIGTAIPTNTVVVASDSVPMVNKSGATITPSTGTATSTDLITDGLITLASALAGTVSLSTVTESVITGDGVATTAPTGTLTVVPQTQVEVFWNGIRQIAGTDYTVSGTTITFTTAIPNGLKVYIRVIS